MSFTEVRVVKDLKNEKSKALLFSRFFNVFDVHLLMPRIIFKTIQY